MIIGLMFKAQHGSLQLFYSMYNKYNTYPQYECMFHFIGMS